MILTNSGVLKLMQRIKSYIASQLNTKAPSVHTHTISEIDDLSSLQMGGGYTKSEVDTLLTGKADTSHTHTKSEITDFPNLSTVATSGNYNDLTNKPTIPTVDSALSSTSTNALQNKVINTELSKKANTGHTHTVSDVTDFPTLATVATSGSYNDLSNKPATMTPTSHTHGNITNDGKIGSNANKPLITTTGGTVTTGSFGTSANTFCEGNDSRLSDARTPTAHTHTVSDVTDFPTLSTVATSGSYNDLSNKPTIPTVNNATLTIQKNGTTVKTFTANASSNVTANITVPTKVSELDNDSNYLTSVPNLDASKITSGTIDIARLPAGALERLVTVTNKTARFALTTSSVQLGDVVKQTDTGVMYYVVDTANLNSEDGYSEFTAGTATSVPWSGVTGKPSSYTPSSHTHGNITNAGAIGTTANKPLITTTNGVITTGSFGTTANTFCQGNDSRLSDARTPTAHTHSASDITSGLATVATSGSYADLSNKPTIPTVNNATLTIQKNGTTVKTFTANASSNVTANITVPTKTSDLTNDSHVSITTETDTTSTGTPAHGGTFTCIDSVTRDSNGHVTKVNTKTITLPSDSNTDTLVTQNVSTANENHPILLSVTKDATTNQGAKTSIFASGVKVNPSTGTVTATAFSGNLTGNVTGNVSGSSGSCTGNSATATKATNNANGKELTNTIIKGLSISGKTITYTQIDGNTGTLTTQDNNTWTAMVGATSSSNGSVGYVNAVPPKDGYNTKYLRADGTWQVPPDHTYTVNNATLTIQKNGSNVATFTSNASSNVTANISVPTKVSQLTNDSGYITSTVGALEMKGNSPYIDFHGSNSTLDYTSRIVDNGTANTGKLRLVAYYNSASYQVEMYKNYFEPVSDNDIYLGDGPNRWKTVYSTTGSISTSDLRLKNTITDIDDSLLDAWETIQPKQYKFNDATETKGEQARLHTGYIAQDIEKACTDNNIDATRYGLFCFDSWEEEPEVTEDVEVEKDGVKTTEKRIVQQKREKGDSYSLRYEEALVVECAYIRRENTRLKTRLDTLESRFEQLEQSLK